MKSVALLAALGAVVTLAPQRPVLPPADRQRLAEGFRLADAVADSLWPGWGATPFEVLLVTPSHEFLIRPARQPTGFEHLGPDSVLGGDVWVRPRVFSPDLLATFPAFGLPPTIVIGQAEQTGLTPARWIVTLLHEHFHQLQMADPDYSDAARRLGLGDDENAMWMLNYPFPYDSAPVARAFAALSTGLSAAVSAIPTDSFAVRVAAVPRLLAEFTTRLGPADERYFWFQVWQEGVSRYTELRVARAGGPAYAEAAHALRADILRRLGTPDLAAQRRSAFYALGAGLALVLDETDPAWRARYRANKFAPLF